MIILAQSFFFCLQYSQPEVWVQLLVHCLEFLNCHWFESAISWLENSNLEFHLAEFFLIFLLLLFLILLLQHFQFTLLFLKSLLDNFGSCYNSLLHLFHYVCFYLYSYLIRGHWVICIEPSFLEERFEVVIRISWTLIILIFGFIFFEFFSSFII